MTGGTVDAVIDSHWHDDHIWGNKVFDVRTAIISTEETHRMFIATRGHGAYDSFMANAEANLEARRAQLHVCGHALAHRRPPHPGQDPSAHPGRAARPERRSSRPCAARPRTAPRGYPARAGPADEQDPVDSLPPHPLPRQGLRIWGGLLLPPVSSRTARKVVYWRGEAGADEDARRAMSRKSSPVAARRFAWRGRPAGKMSPRFP